MEYETMPYNFDRLLYAISSLVSESERKSALNTIKDELNLFFSDFKCNNVIFTMNTDNEFFGIQLSPMINNYNRIDELFNCKEKNIKFEHYSVEFDSKLFNGNFTASQILALLIHDINELNTPRI